MAVTVTCECGHVTELADRDQPADVTVGAAQVCSACGCPLTPPAPAGKRMFQQLWQSHVGDETPAESPSETVTAANITEPVAEEPVKPRRSLWDVMRGSKDSAPPAESEMASVTDNIAPKEAKPKGLWEVMHSTSTEISDGPDSSLLPLGEGGRRPDEGRFDERPFTVDAASTEAMRRMAASTDVDRQFVPHPGPLPKGEGETTVHNSPPLPTSTALTPEQKYAQAASLASMTHIAATWRPEPEPEPFDEDERVWSLRAVTALAISVATLIVAASACRPEWWWRGPALVTGLVAVLLGFLAAGDVRRSRGRLKGVWLARSSVVIGTCGMFLAPLVFARLGERQRENAGREDIEWRLRRIGQGLDQFHNQEGHFPESAIRGRDAHGDNVPMHGWMTPLLPSLGYDAVYRRIDLNQPFDAPVNIPAMQQPIPEFSLPHRKPIRSPRGFALTHFAGVGGQEIREPGGLVHLGMFNDGGPVKREQFTDGLSQTIIVGEIRDRDPPAPAWGEPGNVRSIGEGLNRQFRGFGNANGSGATFLHADGSVKFYSNKTDRRVLEQLESRDGGEQ